MSTEIDFKGLWNKQGMAAIPEKSEIIKQAYRVKTNTRDLLIRANLGLLVTLGIIFTVLLNIDNAQLTTKVGVIIIGTGIIMYAYAFNGMIPLILKTSMHSSAHEYLEQMIAIRRKYEFLNGIVIGIYYILLSVGLALYTLQFIKRMSITGGVIYSVIVVAWLAVCWFYLRPRGVKKRMKPLNETIEQLKRVNEQFNDLA